MRLTRDLLDSDVAVLTQIGNGRETARRSAGEWPGMDSFDGAWSPLEETVCLRMLEGRIGNYICDAQGDDRVNDLPMVRSLGIGAYLGVPIRIDDGHSQHVVACERASNLLSAFVDANRGDVALHELADQHVGPGQDELAQRNSAEQMPLGIQDPD